MSIAIERDPNNIFFRCVEDCSEAIMITNRKGNLVYVNPSWQKIYGYSEQEALVDTPRILRSETQDINFYQKMWEDILNPKKGFWRGELVNRTKLGDPVPVLLTITPFRETGGEVTGYMGIAVDMREQKSLEGKVLHQDRLASIGVLASGLAHEIGTPLGTIRGRAEMMQSYAKENEKIQSGLSIIISQIDRVSKMINSLLRLSRSKREVELRSISLLPILKEIENLFLEKCTRQKIRFEVKCSPEIKVYAERSRMEQVLVNLCINSMHAIEEKKSTPDSVENFIELVAMQDKDFVHLTVQDSGCGIEKKNFENLFKAFFTTKDVGHGTGLGLAMVAKILDELQGHIDVESEMGKGSTFRLKFIKS